MRDARLRPQVARQASRGPQAKKDSFFQARLSMPSSCSAPRDVYAEMRSPLEAARSSRAQRRLHDMPQAPCKGARLLSCHDGPCHIDA